MRRCSLVGLVLLAAPFAAAPLAAQQQGRPGVEALRQQVMERFLQTYHDQAGLTPDQDQRFRDVLRRAMGERQDVQQREQAMWRALEAQMRPGVAANADSVNKLLDGVIAQRIALAELTRSENQELAKFLSPVQRAQFALMWERFQQQVEGVMRRRMQMRGGGLPGTRLRPDTIP